MREKKFTVKEIAPFMINLCDAMTDYTRLMMEHIQTEEEIEASIRAAKATAELSLFLWGKMKIDDPQFEQVKAILGQFVKAD